jgi:deoxyribodipyrimidine photolyase-related protein
MASKRAFLILGNQLFPPQLIPNTDLIYMAEDYGLCTHFRFHKHKLVLFLSAMRHYRDDLKKEQRTGITYRQLSKKNLHETYEAHLGEWISEKGVGELHLWEVEDKFMERRIFALASKIGLTVIIHPSPGFLCGRVEFAEYLKKTKKPFMKTFYEQQRRNRKLLLTPEGGPLGGQWSFDEDNRKKLPPGITPPQPPKTKASAHVEAVKILVNQLFPKHPGDTKDFWLPVSREESIEWLHSFLADRFRNFGPYEDALSKECPFLFHSLLSPLMNLGLLLPSEVVDLAVSKAESEGIPMQSVEGFIRQIVGWREFVRGIYQNYSEELEIRNFWNHQSKLSTLWYEGDFGVPVLDDAVKKTVRYGYNHHIERLMVISNTMFLLGVHPKEAYRWFMEMYVDSLDWVMAPNVFGMGQYSDGGIFTTKPYICGSNYWLKMSHYKKGEWCHAIDGLYWEFIQRNRDFFAKNPRTSMMAKMSDKISKEKWRTLSTAALEFRRLALAE